MYFIKFSLFSGIKNDFRASLNTFMSSVTETHHRLQCQTVLYVPKEALASPIDIASKNKELCARLESKFVSFQIVRFFTQVYRVKIF